MEKVVVGYFVWRRDMKGGARPCKHLKENRDGAQPETKKLFEEETIGTPIPLDDAEWFLTLDALILKYPAPKKPEPEIKP